MNNIIVNVLPGGFRQYIDKINIDDVEEIRLRASKNAIVHLGRGKGEIVTDYIASREDINESLEYISAFSLYAYEEDIKQGFITIRGGHRVGLAGKVTKEGGRIKTISNISSLNIRVSHQVLGCGEKVVKYVAKGNTLDNTLIISSPGAGKTTLLRDMLRELSDVYKLKVSLVDERSEIAACYNGIAQNDIGIRTDVYDCCPKSDGIMLMIRAMSPQVVAVDELGSCEDMEAIKEASRCGCKIIATIHGDNVDDILHKAFVNENKNDSLFERYIFIKNDFKRQYYVYDKSFNELAVV